MSVCRVRHPGRDGRLAARNRDGPAHVTLRAHEVSKDEPREGISNLARPVRVLRLPPERGRRAVRPEAADDAGESDHRRAYSTSSAITAVITSGSDGRHSGKSKHYSRPEALDYRTRSHDMPEQVSKAIAREIAERLNASLFIPNQCSDPCVRSGHFDVLWKPSHIHVEFDPAPAGCV